MSSELCAFEMCNGVKNHENIYNKLNYFYERQKVPHIIFHGSSGSGKRTIVDNYLKKIYQNDSKKMKTNIMFVNCAHGKGGIKFIRDDLKFFAKTNIHSNSGVLFKTIVLLNADKLTIDAQSALRRCIELFSSNTRFFIIVENKHKLLNPILSRFCEIYVPEHIENGKVINLHQLKMNNNMCYNRKQQEEHQWINNKINNTIINNDNDNIHINLLELSVEFYENGLSCLDLIKWIENNDKMNGKNKTELLMTFDKIKPEYRCEKLLLLYLFDSLKNVLKNNR